MVFPSFSKTIFVSIMRRGVKSWNLRFSQVLQGLFFRGTGRMEHPRHKYNILLYEIITPSDTNMICFVSENISPIDTNITTTTRSQIKLITFHQIQVVSLSASNSCLRLSSIADTAANLTKPHSSLECSSKQKKFTVHTVLQL